MFLILVWIKITKNLKVDFHAFLLLVLSMFQEEVNMFI